MRSLLETNPLVLAAVLSVLVHAAAFGVVANRSLWTGYEDKPKTVKVRIVESTPETLVEEPPPPKPPEPKKPEKPKRPEKKVATERAPPKDPPKEPPKPIQGLTEDSFDKTGTSAVSAPMGNTLMTEDTGERVSSPPPALDVDLSADPQLIRSSIVTPQYTDAALDAGFEGSVMVEVLVDQDGKVTQAELAKKVGYGMDQRILDAAYAARFVPRKNRLGRAESGWTAIKFNMEIP